MDLQKGGVAQDQQKQVFWLQCTPPFNILDTYIKGTKYFHEEPQLCYMSQYSVGLKD